MRDQCGQGTQEVQLAHSCGRESQSRRDVSVLLMCVSPSCHPQIREQNLQDIKTAGPQSQVLSGVMMDRSLIQVSAQKFLLLLRWESVTVRYVF